MSERSSELVRRDTSMREGASAHEHSAVHEESLRESQAAGGKPAPEGERPAATPPGEGTESVRAGRAFLRALGGDVARIGRRIGRGLTPAEKPPSRAKP